MSIWQSTVNINADGAIQNPTAVVEEHSLDDAVAVQRRLIAEEDIRPSLTGVVSIKLRSAALANWEKHTTRLSHCFCSVILRNFQKKTRVVAANDGVFVFDQSKHFSIPVPRDRRHPFNALRIQVFAFDEHRPEEQLLVGAVSFHLHDLISSSPIAGRYDVWNDNMQVGDLDLELTFNYGVFGYGYSAQLKEDEVNAKDMVAYSLFPRLHPHDEEQEPDDPIIAVKATPHPKFLPFKEPAHLSYGKEIAPTLKALEQTVHNPDALVREMRDDVCEAVRDKYLSIHDRAERIVFLHNFLREASMKTERMVNPPKIPTAEFYSRGYTRFVQPAAQASGRQDARAGFRKRVGLSGLSGLSGASAAEKEKVAQRQTQILRSAVLDAAAQPRSPTSATPATGVTSTVGEGAAVGGRMPSSESRRRISGTSSPLGANSMRSALGSAKQFGTLGGDD